MAFPLAQRSKVSFQVFSSSLNPPPLLCSYLITDTALVEVLLTSDSVYQYSTHTVVRISLMQTFREALCLRSFLTPPHPPSPATEKCSAYSLGRAKPSKTWCRLAYLVLSPTDTRARFFNDSMSLPLTSALPGRLPPLGEFNFQHLEPPFCESKSGQVVIPSQASGHCVGPHSLCQSPGLSCSSELRRATEGTVYILHDNSSRARSSTS